MPTLTAAEPNQNSGGGEEDQPQLDPAQARKRRLELLRMQRGVPAAPAEAEPIVATSNPEVPAAKKRKTSSATAKKKTQMRYDPEVPMSREEAAAWRREARRVRNRESAAASRQKTRDHITRLENELNDLKSQFHEMFAAVRRFEDVHQVQVLDPNFTAEAPASSTAAPTQESAVPTNNTVSPCASPLLSATPEDQAVLSALAASAADTVDSQQQSGESTSSQKSEEEKHLNMISRPAVKIENGASPDSSSQTYTGTCTAALVSPVVSSADSAKDEVDGMLNTKFIESGCTMPPLENVVSSNSSSDASTAEASSDEEEPVPVVGTQDLDEFLMDALEMIGSINYDPIVGVGM